MKQNTKLLTSLQKVDSSSLELQYTEYKIIRANSTPNCPNQDQITIYFQTASQLLCFPMKIHPQGCDVLWGMVEEFSPMKVWVAGKQSTGPLGELAQARERNHAMVQLGCPAATAACFAKSTLPLLRSWDLPVICRWFNAHPRKHSR